MSESEKIKQLIDEQVKHLTQKRDQVLSKVQDELDDIDKALRQLGYNVPPGVSGSVNKKRRREKVDDKQIEALLRSFMQTGESFTAAEILSRLDIKAARFSAFKAAHKNLLKTHGAKRSMKYSLNTEVSPASK